MVELRALGSTGSPPGGARRRSRAGRARRLRIVSDSWPTDVSPWKASSLLTEDHCVLKGPCCCRVVLGGRKFFCLSRWPRHSICSLEASVAIAGEWNTSRGKRHSRRSATCGNGRG